MKSLKREKGSGARAILSQLSEPFKTLVSGGKNIKEKTFSSSRTTKFVRKMMGLLFGWEASKGGQW